MYYSTGSGTLPHLNMERLKLTAKFPATHVPYKASAAGLTDLLGGRVHLTFDAAAVTLPHLKAGKLRALAVSSPRRLAALPDVPALAEMYPGFESGAWLAMMAPAGTPAAIIEKVSADVRSVLAKPDVTDRIAASGNEVISGSAEDLAALLWKDFSLYGKVVKDLGLRVD